MTTREVTTPDLGDFHDVPVIEILVREGQEVAEGDGLVSLESDKAVMDVPAPVAGRVRSILVRKGSTVSTGTPVAVLEIANDEASASSSPPAPASREASAEEVPSPSSSSAGERPAEAPSRGEEAKPSRSAPAPRGEVTVKVPDLGDFHDVPVIEILVREGQEVAEGDGLVSLESDKAVMDVPTPVAGRVRSILVRKGSTVSKDTPVAVLETVAAPDETAGKAPAPAARTSRAPSPPEPPSVAPQASADAPHARTPSAPDAEGGERPVHAGPHVRRLARELGIDLRRVRGSGPRGRVRPVDLAAASAASSPALPVPDHARFGPIETVPLGRIPRLSGPRLQASWSTVPHVTQHDRADITRLDALRRELNAALGPSGPHLTLLPFVLRACVRALLRHPTVNASLSADGTELILKKYYHIGVAVDTPEGLVVPVVRDVGEKDIFALARALADVSARARDGRLQPSDLQGASFSVSSLGGIGGTGFTPIVNAPQVAILGLSRASLEPVWQDEGFVPRLMLPLSFSYDHRVIDGAEAVRFTRTLAGVLETLEGLVG
jgi:pyruvate dehydrogenase E2 component (dihydrolipoamide acetyltransferase)